LLSLSTNERDVTTAALRRLCNDAVRRCGPKFFQEFSMNFFPCRVTHPT
jgi:hypothetical protein